MGIRFLELVPLRRRRRSGLAASETALRRALENYRRNAQRLRAIHSLKLSRAQRFGFWSTTTLILLSAGATFIGFVGTDELSDAVDLNEDVFVFIFNGFLLGLLVAVIVDLSYRSKERAYEHQRALVVLTTFVREIEDVLEMPSLPSEGSGLLERFRSRYALIIEILPPHTDADFLASKEAEVDKWTKEAELAARAASIPGLRGRASKDTSFPRPERSEAT